MPKKRTEKKPVQTQLQKPRTKIVPAELTLEQHHQLRIRAAQAGMGMAEYVTRLVIRDLGLAYRPKGGE